MCDIATGYVGVLRNLTNEDIEKYTYKTRIYILPDSATFIDLEKAYLFIVTCFHKGIYKFVLHIPSGNLISLYQFIKQNSSLHKCYFVATLSNAPIARTVTNDLKFYFPLTVVTDLIRTYTGIPPPPGNVMIVVSNDPNPYFKEILNSGPQPAYTINELTVEKVNDFALTGYQIIVAIVFPEEMDKFIAIMNNPECQYKRQVVFLEIRSIFIEQIRSLKNLSSIVALSSGVSLAANKETYPTVPSITLYDNSSLTFCNTSKSWKQFKNSGVLAKGKTYYGANTVPLT